MNSKNVLILAFLSIGFLSQPVLSQSKISIPEYDEAIKIAENEGKVRVMITLQTGHGLTDSLNVGGSPTDNVDTSSPAKITDDYLQRLGQEGISVVQMFEETPTLILDVTSKALAKVTQDNLVASVVYLSADTRF